MIYGEAYCIREKEREIEREREREGVRECERAGGSGEVEATVTPPDIT